MDEKEQEFIAGLLGLAIMGDSLAMLAKRPEKLRHDYVGDYEVSTIYAPWLSEWQWETAILKGERCAVIASAESKQEAMENHKSAMAAAALKPDALMDIHINMIIQLDGGKADE